MWNHMVVIGWFETLDWISTGTMFMHHSWVHEVHGCDKQVMFWCSHRDSRWATVILCTVIVVMLAPQNNNHYFDKYLELNQYMSAEGNWDIFMNDCRICAALSFLSKTFTFLQKSTTFLIRRIPFFLAPWVVLTIVVLKSRWLPYFFKFLIYTFLV